MIPKKCCLTVGLLLLANMLLPALVRANEITDSVQDLEIHAYASQGFMVSTDNNFLTDSTAGSFEFSEIGLNFTKILKKNLLFGVQFFSRDLGSIGDYTARFDWYYLSYIWSDTFGIRVGRIKVPFGLYNDSSDIDSARTPILLPQSIYPSVNRDFLLAQTGVEFFGRFDLRSYGALEYRLYGGTIFVDFENDPSSTTQVISIDSPYIVGTRLLWETPVQGLRVGGSLQALELDINELIGSTELDLIFPVVLWVGSAEYIYNKWSLAAEYGRWSADLHTRDGSFRLKQTNERAYVMAAYQLSKRNQPGLYYSILYPNVDQRSGRENQLKDLAATWRFDLNENWLLKLEAHYMHGTAELSSDLNDGRSASELAEDWGLFMVKTTVYF